MKNYIFSLASFLFISLLSLSGYFSYGRPNIVSANLYYSYVSGSTYTITLVVEASCGAAYSYGSMYVASPIICIYDGSTPADTLSLVLQPPDSGLEITSLCAGDTSDCVNPLSAIPGIKKFVYSANYILPHTSALWRFLFTGNLGSISAGRNATITNLLDPGSYEIQLVDTLNNTVYNNHNAIFTINPPTSFCANLADMYNPAAIDPDGDSLSFSLISAMEGDGSCTEGPSCSYLSFSYYVGGSTLLSGSFPLQVDAPGGFSMDSRTGEMVFTAPVVQIATVVYNIQEYRGGSYVGSSQREMNFYVYTCTASTPCYGMPDAGNAVNSAGCYGAPDTLSLSGASIGCGLDYQWQYSTDSVSWTNISGATNATYLYHPTVSRYYRCVLTCTLSGLSANSGTVFTWASGILLHCVIYSPYDTLCNGPEFYVTSCGTSTDYNVTTYYGDGTSDNHALTTVPVYYAEFTHVYSAPGTYTIKQVLYEGVTPVDSLTFSYNYTYCRTLPVKFFYDAHHSCVFDSGDSYIYTPVLTEIDSNGIPIDTISATSGFYYNAYGGPGTVYTFRTLSGPRGLYVSCPSSAVIYDTIQSYVTDYATSYFAFNCSSSTAYDLSENAFFCAGTTRAHALIIVQNSYCTPETPVVTMVFSPNYVYDYGSYPAPATVSGNTVTWNLDSGITYTNPPPLINITLWDTSSTPLAIGDTVHSSYRVTPVIGDVDTFNNSSALIDTVQSAFDPNGMSVNPSGYISAGTQLQYTINFENTGNVSAQNIYIMDTLPGYLDAKSLKIVAASAVMVTAPLNNRVSNIIKFDFPHINLLDSAYHNRCDGMVIFNINTLSGLPNGTTIFNHAGIFFDDNAPVLTNTVEDIIGTQTVPSGTSVLKKSNVEIYPNPATSTLTIKMNNGAYSSFIITNTIGQALIQQSINTAVTNVSVQSLPAGIYYITLRGAQGRVVNKFVKM